MGQRPIAQAPSTKRMPLCYPRVSSACRCATNDLDDLWMLANLVGLEALDLRANRV